MVQTLEEIKAEVKSNKDRISNIRQSIINFATIVRSGVLNGWLDLNNDFYHRFQLMRPCLHRKCFFDNPVDSTAFIYSLSRLPTEVIGTDDIFIQKEAENLDGISGINRVDAGLRRRAVYNVGSQLTFVAREGETDIFDIVTCLSMFGIEAEKIKNNLSSCDFFNSANIKVIKSSNESINQYLGKSASRFGIGVNEILRMNNSLNGGLVDIIDSIVKFRPDSRSIRFDPSFSLTDQSKKAEYWSKEIIGMLDKYEDRPIAIVSSDTHSIINCLSGFANKNKESLLRLSEYLPQCEILDYGNKSNLYYLMNQLIKTGVGSSILEEKIAYEDTLGVEMIKDKYETGVDVQIIDVTRILENDPQSIDSRIKYDYDSLKNKGLVILNMDYSFGRQGFYNMKELCIGLKDRIESISISGKAGLTCEHMGGKKFDIMIPEYVLPQIDSGVYDFPTGNGLKKRDFKGLFPECNVHNGGPMLTVPGTAMQSDLLLKYYIADYNILGVEMEASPYLDAIEKRYMNRTLRKDLVLNVGYWASDVPLDPNATLAENHMEHGIVPSYAINIAILNKVFGK